MRSCLVISIICTACGSDPSPPGDKPMADAAESVDAPVMPVDSSPGACQTQKIMFTQATGCTNDGSVEFCIPDNDPQLRSQLTAISSTITCAGGGGRAMCNDPPGRLLCFYPTGPTECDGADAMTAETWQDMCAIAAFPQVTAIVPTWFE